MSVSSRAMPLGEMFALGHFVPATVQREYQWEEMQNRQLLEDIADAMERQGNVPPRENAPQLPEPPEDRSDGAEGPAVEIHGELIRQSRAPRSQYVPAPLYHLGTVVLLKAPRARGRYYIYDGLQRLASLTILLASMRDQWREGRRGALRTIRDLLAPDPERLGANAPLVMPTPGGTLARVLRPETRGGAAAFSQADFRVRNAKRLFDSNVSTWSDGYRQAFVDFLLGKVTVTLTEVEGESLAYQMFVSANDRGLRLSVGDNLKGLLVERARELGETQDRVDAAAKVWVDAQRSLRNGFNDFVGAIEVLKFRPETDQAHHTGQLLSAHLESDQHDPPLTEWVRGEFHGMAVLFENARAHLRYQTNEGIDLSYRQLSFLSWKEWQPFYLALGTGIAGQPSETWKRQLTLLRDACYIIELLDWSARARRRRFLAAIEQLEQGLSPFSGRLPGGTGGALSLSHAARKAAVRNLRGAFEDFERRGAVVRLLETLSWDPAVPRSCTDGASVEHILPQTPMGEWARRFDHKQRERWTERLGNLCLIPRDMNERIGNAEPDVKLAEYVTVRERFALLNDALSHTPVGGSMAWSPEIVEERTERLAQRVESALGLV